MIKEITSVDEALKEARKGEKILQYMRFDLTTYLVAIGDDYFLETWRYISHVTGHILHSVECVSEETARFSLSARYEV
jgi:hypothetical protein